MSYESKEQIFLYHAYGLGIGGWIERKGTKFLLESVAPGALSVVGGLAESSQKKYTFQQAGFSISVAEATTKLWSRETDEEWITDAESTLVGFDLCGRVKADRIVSRLTSRHSKQTDRKREKERARISFKGSMIEGLSIDDTRVSIDTDDLLDEFPTYAGLNDLIGGKKVPSPRPGFDKRQCATWSKNLKRKNLLQSKRSDPQYVRDLAKLTSAKVTRCSIAREIGPLDLKHARTHGYSVEIDDFGRIFFGEMLVADGMKRLNMIRWDLGCDDCGGGTGGTSDLNGASMP